MIDYYVYSVTNHEQKHVGWFRADDAWKYRDDLVCQWRLRGIDHSTRIRVFYRDGTDVTHEQRGAK